METWFRSRFEVVVAYPPEHEEYVVFGHLGRMVMIPIDKLVSYCSDLDPSNVTIESLKAIDPGDGFGWHTFFDSWDAQGLLDP